MAKTETETDPRVGKDGRRHVTFRVGPGGYDWLETVVLELGRGCDRSMVLRAALAVARRHEAELKTILKEQM